MPNDRLEQVIKGLRAARKRQRQAAALRAQGKTFAEIGAAMGGISRQRAKQLVDRALKDQAAG